MREGFHILFMAPEPFYQERGTPIAVDLLLRVLSERGARVDVLTYHEGRDVEYPHVSIHRIVSVPFVRNIRPGFSWRKVICDVFMFFKAIRLVSKRRYQLVHAVEESVFIAVIVKILFGIPYVYDMDSSLSEQMIDTYPWLRSFRRVFERLEAVAVRRAKAVVSVSDVLAGKVQKYNPEKIVVIPDVSLLDTV